MSYWIGYFLILLGVGGGLITLLIYLSRRKTTPPLLLNLTLSIVTLFVTFMGLEFYFKVFFDESDSLDTLARQNWRERYANPTTYNSWGFRDIQWTDQMVTGKTKVMIVGDSFVEGVGLKNPQDRFSNLLGQKLGSNYAVFNLGKAGTNTQHHIKYIVDYPYAPDILILTYYINDIEGAVTPENWLKRPPGPKIPALLAPVVNNSYVLNFFYWRLYHLLEPGGPGDTWRWLLTIYDDPEDWWIHQQQLLAIYQGAKAEDIPLVVVVFPNMTYIEESRLVTERIINFFQDKGVSTLDVADLIEKFPTDELIASPVDPHPSQLVNELVAEALYQMFVEQGLVKK